MALFTLWIPSCTCLWCAPPVTDRVAVPRAPGNLWKAQSALQHPAPRAGAHPSSKERFEKMSEMIQKLPAPQRSHHSCSGPTAQASLTLTLTLSRLWAKWRETAKRSGKYFPFSGFLIYCWYCQLDQLTEGSGMLHSWAKRTSGPGASAAQAEVEQPELGGNNCLFPETTFSASWNLLSPQPETLRPWSSWHLAIRKGKTFNCLHGTNFCVKYISSSPLVCTGI